MGTVNILIKIRGSYIFEKTTILDLILYRQSRPVIHSYPRIAGSLEESERKRYRPPSFYVSSQNRFSGGSAPYCDSVRFY